MEQVWETISQIGVVYYEIMIKTYELSGCGLKSHCSHLNFKYRAFFEQGVPWSSGNSKVWIYSETCTWHDKNVQLKNDSLWNRGD